MAIPEMEHPTLNGTDRKCADTVAEVFPGIDPIYLATVIKSLGNDAEYITLRLMQQVDATGDYPRQLKPAKRKREDEKQDQSTHQDPEPKRVLKSPKDEDTRVCLCCFEDVSVASMVHCDTDGEKGPHWFCINCCRKNAELQVGRMKYDIPCPVYGGKCAGSFSDKDKQQFIDVQLQKALDSIEHQEVLTMLADVEDVESCPWCAFAVDYPSVGDVKELHCGNPACALITCRLCRGKAHGDEPCEDIAQKRALCHRQSADMAGSQEVMDRCNICSTAFFDGGGYDHMTCASCGNTQCYDCRENYTPDSQHCCPLAVRNGRRPLHPERAQKLQREMEELQTKAASSAAARVRYDEFRRRYYGSLE